MASDLTTAAPQVTAAQATSSALVWLREALPFRAVVLPWLVARLLVVPALVLTGKPGEVQMGRLIWMDGQWFRLIAVNFYDRPYIDGRWSEYPFFPLFPSLGGVLMKLGASPTLALAGISWLAALAAMAGAYRLAVRHLPVAAAPWAPWFIAIAPGAVTMVLGYADSLYLAGLVWALVLAEDRRWWAAGLLAAVATASRPNGVIATLAVVVTVLAARAGLRALVAVAAPSVVFLVGWCWYLWWATGDPLVFWSAKDAWSEISLATLLSDPFNSRHEPGWFHLGFLLLLTVPYAMRARQQPLAWAFVVVLGVVPPLMLGVEGLARYAILAFPMPLAAADVLTARHRWPAAVCLVASGAAMALLAVAVIRWSWLP